MGTPRYGTIEALASFCDVWTIDDLEGFQDIVASYLVLTGNRTRPLADEFETGLCTITRWAGGAARPRARIRRLVVDWIAAQRVSPPFWRRLLL